MVTKSPANRASVTLTDLFKFNLAYKSKIKQFHVIYNNSEQHVGLAWGRNWKNY